MKIFPKPTAWFLWLCISFLILPLMPAEAELPSRYEMEILAKAEADEYFYAIGSDSNQYVKSGIDPAVLATNGAMPKVNQAYVWGMAIAEDKVWFGTGANVSWLTAGAYLGGGMPPFFDRWGLSFVAEFGESKYARDGIVPDELGDWRPADIYMYDTEKGTLTHKNGDLDTTGANLLLQTLGMRSAGTSKANTQNPQTVALLAGPSISVDEGDGCNFFAFDAITGDYLEARAFPEYNHIRKWLLYEGILYTTVGLTSGNGGAILRWINDPGHADYPFAFQLVGNIDNPGSELAAHEGRLFVTTWPDFETVDMDNPMDILNKPSALWMSPVIGPNGLTTSDTAGWIRVWKPSDYEPDTIIAATYGCGALASFEGYLYWGTMHLGSAGVFAQGLIYGGSDTNYYGEDLTLYTNALDRQIIKAAHSQNSKRATTIFRGKDFRKPVEILGVTVVPGGEFDLLYGETELPVYDPANGSGTSGWANEANLMGQAPLFGSSGFGNPGNRYTWIMQTHKNRLYIGTMDNYVSNAGMPPPPVPGREDGSDLWCFRSSSLPAELISGDGMGNEDNHGIRTIVADGNAIYLGTANGANLRMPPTHTTNLGGWELIKLTYDAPSVFNDFSGNGISDTAIFDTNAGFWYIKTVSDNLITWANQWGWSTAKPVPGDYDGDGICDLAVFDKSNGNWYIRKVSDTNPVIAWAKNWGWSTVTPVSGDYDGDGIDDLAVFDKNGGNWYIRKVSDVDPVISWAKNWGWSTAIPVPGDYDGDGIDDLAVFDTVGGYWYIKTVSGNTIAWKNQWGWSGALPVPGDYDGDGIDDLAIFDTAGGYWYIKTVSGSTITWANQWGWSTAKPVPGDYNGDGTDDLAVFDDVGGYWYIKTVSGNTIAWKNQWGWSGAEAVGISE